MESEHQTLRIDMIGEIKCLLESVKGIPGLAQQLSDSADIVDEVGIDSLEMLQFMLEIESRLRVQIDFEAMEFSYLKSIKKLSEFLATMEREG